MGDGYDGCVCMSHNSGGTAPQLHRMKKAVSGCRNVFVCILYSTLERRLSISTSNNQHALCPLNTHKRAENNENHNTKVFVCLIEQFVSFLSICYSNYYLDCAQTETEQQQQ